ncbi:MAG TPA: D-sedoheptulose 7-phosphate isomerase [Nitrospinota bacterium]|nr:D-sedoheptulose 7-phosphate isomerase [Nitrospinota bacterium]
MSKAKEALKEALIESSEITIKIADTLCSKIEKIIELIVDAIRKKKKILIMGNGGSAADAQHLVAELVGRFKLERKAIPAIALTTNTSTLTAIGNDYSFDKIFGRQIEALAEEGDIVLGLSTSGLSENLIYAFKIAKDLGATTIGFLGKDGGKVKDIVDISILIPSNNTPRIQEAHITIGHIICEEIEKRLNK